MSLQGLYSWVLAHPAQSLNGLALFFSVAGSWLLLATRWRSQRAELGLAGVGEEISETLDEVSSQDEATQRINRFFYGFGAATLLLSLLLSFVSRGL